jgi:hypothetical protein
MQPNSQGMASKGFRCPASAGSPRSEGNGFLQGATSVGAFTPSSEPRGWQGVNQLTDALEKARYDPNPRLQQTRILQPTTGGEPCPPPIGF